MNEDASSTPCLFTNEEDLPPSTALYRYMSTEAFLYLMVFQRMMISKITDWPDSFEGTRFEFLKKIKDNEFSHNSKDDFYASCWTLQTEERCLYESEEQFEAAQEELSRNGSAAMWESYCKNGGVRIKTTLGKIDQLLSTELHNWNIFRGKVYYEPSKSWTMTIHASSIIKTLLHKRVSFRSESEYRFILISENTKNLSKISIPIGDLFEFLDEILIAPATSSNKWLSRTLYNIAVGVSIAPPKRTTVNSKEGKQYCHISQLYSKVSETIGHFDMS